MRKLLVCVAFIVATVHAQNCTGYAKEYTITIQPGAITGTLANYTMLISGTYSYLGVGGAGLATNTSGYDITFNQATTPLTWNMPIYNSGTGQIKANVLIPSASVGTVLSMCVGNAAITTFRGGASAYDSSTAMALQFPSTGVTVDSTARQTVTNMGGATHVTTGPTYLIDAMALNGTGQYLNTGAPVAFPGGDSDRTTTFWVNLTSTADYAILIGWGTQSVNNQWCALLYGGKLILYDGAGNRTAGPAVQTGVWHRYDIVYLGGWFRIYADGVQTYVSIPGTLNTLLNASTVGALPGGSNLTNGQMADVRVIAAGRTPEWIAAEYLNQTNPAAFYSSVVVVVVTPPIISNVTIAANSPYSVKMTWTTDVPASSQTQCGTTSGVYTFNSSIINPTPLWSVTAHSMPSNPMPNGSYYCRARSMTAAGGIGVSAEQTLVVLPAVTPSVPIAMVNPNIKLQGKLGDSYSGVKGAPATGAWSQQDNGYFAWADDNNEYYETVGWGLPGPKVPMWAGIWPSLGMQYVKFTDAGHTVGSQIGTDWQNGINNLGFNSFHNTWLCTPTISVSGAMYVHPCNFGGGDAFTSTQMIKTTDHFQSTLNAHHNVGPDTTYLTNMTCTGAGVITATSKLNVSDELPIIKGPCTYCLGQMAMFIQGASGTNVNGSFGPVTSATATGTTWINQDPITHVLSNSCAGWSWSPIGGTGSGGGTINVYGWDVPSDANNAHDGMRGETWIQNDGPDYVNGTKTVGMDSMVYSFAAASNGIMGLDRMRIEDMPLQDVTKTGHYVGKQIADDGFYESSWDYTNTLPTTVVNGPQFNTRVYGKGSPFPQGLYLTALNRFVIAFEATGEVDSMSAGTVIYDGGQYPWSPITMIGHVQRNPDVYPYMASGPEFPQFAAKSQKSLNGVTSVSIGHNGGNFGGHNDPALNEYDMYMNLDLQFVAKNSTATVVKPMLAAGEIPAGMDVAYNFDVLTGSLSMPNAAPSDSTQKWAWRAANPIHPIYTDQYGSILHSLPAVAASGGYYPISVGKIQSVGFPTPYTQALPGPLTVMNCFGQYPASLLSFPSPNAIALQKGTDLVITWSGAALGAPVLSGGVVTSIPILSGGSGFTSPPTITILGDYHGGVGATATGNLTGDVLTSITINTGGSGYNLSYVWVTVSEPQHNWKVSFLGTAVGNISIPDNSIGCAVVRRDSSNRVALFTSAGIGRSLPLTASANATVVGPWTNSPLIIGDGSPSWGTGGIAAGNAFFGSESLLRIWSRDLADDELISEMAAIRGVLWARGMGSAIP